MKTKALTLLMTGLCVVLSSCSNDDPPTSARPPVFKELILTPSSVNPEEEVTAYVEYEYAGKEIYKNDYRLTVTETGNPSNSVSYDWVQLDPTKYNPTQKFKAPKTLGNYTVTFSAIHINYSTGGPGGSPYGSANSVSATLKVLEPQE